MLNKSQMQDRIDRNTLHIKKMMDESDDSSLDKIGELEVDDMTNDLGG